MVRFTLLEVNLDGAEFNAQAPFSGSGPLEAAEDVEESLEDRFERRSDSSGSGRSPAAVLLGLGALAGVLFAARKLRSRRRSGPAGTEREEPIVAD